MNVPEPPGDVSEAGVGGAFYSPSASARYSALT